MSQLITIEGKPGLVYNGLARRLNAKQKTAVLKAKKLDTTGMRLAQLLNDMAFITGYPETEPGKSFPKISSDKVYDGMTKGFVLAQIGNDGYAMIPSLSSLDQSTYQAALTRLNNNAATAAPPPGVSQEQYAKDQALAKKLQEAADAESAKQLQEGKNPPSAPMSHVPKNPSPIPDRPLDPSVKEEKEGNITRLGDTDSPNDLKEYFEGLRINYNNEPWRMTLYQTSFTDKVNQNGSLSSLLKYIDPKTKKIPGHCLMVMSAHAPPTQDSLRTGGYKKSEADEALQFRVDAFAAFGVPLPVGGRIFNGGAIGAGWESFIPIIPDLIKSIRGLFGGNIADEEEGIKHFLKSLGENSNKGGAIGDDEHYRRLAREFTGAGWGAVIPFIPSIIDGIRSLFGGGLYGDAKLNKFINGIGGGIAITESKIKDMTPQPSQQQPMSPFGGKLMSDPLGDYLQKKTSYSGSIDSDNIEVLNYQMSGGAVEGEGLKERINGIIGAIRGTRRNLPPHVRSMLSDNGLGDKPIRYLSVVRTPIQEAISTVLSMVNKISDSDTPPDKLFHLFFVVVCDGSGPIRFEKNEQINMVKYDAKPDLEEGISLDVPSGLTLNKMITNTVQHIGDAMYKYDGFSTNCQHFVYSVIEANRIPTGQRDIEFIVQNVKNLVPSWAKRLAGFATDLANRGEQIIDGEGVYKASGVLTNSLAAEAYQEGGAVWKPSWNPATQGIPQSWIDAGKPSHLEVGGVKLWYPWAPDYPPNKVYGDYMPTVKIIDDTEIKGSGFGYMDVAQWALENIVKPGYEEKTAWRNPVRKESNKEIMEKLGWPLGPGVYHRDDGSLGTGIALTKKN